ncbi:hypothetical protein [Sessilibacter corallicola]|uniref:hypothetical protein n=1 Tax=Sessilibacter corallicola TaxID=2904075 RepID=UPI001E422181|nr:hypothetical protein [Sessilibacter corallicola]MCE2029569.1 hypothetical protein [Sessilibacter corallicola]
MYRFFLIIMVVFLSSSLLAEEITGKPMENLSAGEVGSFEELSSKPNPDNLVLVYIPDIELILEKVRALKGGELSPEEEEAVRMRTTAVATPADIKE